MVGKRQEHLLVMYIHGSEPTHSRWLQLTDKRSPHETVSGKDIPHNPNNGGPVVGGTPP